MGAFIDRQVTMALSQTVATQVPPAVRRRPWTSTAVAGAIITIGLEAWDSFHISQPLGAIIAIVLFLVGITWLYRRPGRGPVVYLGVLFALELLGNFTIFGVIGDLQHQSSWTDFFTGIGYTLGDLVGLIACLVLVATRPRAETFSER